MKTQRRHPTAIAIVLGLAVGVCWPPATRAQVPNPDPPERMTYQGFLVDANGLALGNDSPKNYDIVFRIWQDESSTDPADLLWAEQQTVTVDKGYFSVLLGEGSQVGSEPRPALSEVFSGPTASQRWMGMTVKGIAPGGGDTDILPRLRMLTAPYAFLASRVVHVDASNVVAGTIADARLSPNVALRNAPNTFTADQTVRGHIELGVGKAVRVTRADGSKYSVLEAQSAGNVTYLNYADRALNIRNVQGQSAVYIDANRNVGIGTTAPHATLDLHGTAKMFSYPQSVHGTRWDPTRSGETYSETAPTDGFLSVILTISHLSTKESLNVHVQGEVPGFMLGAASVQNTPNLTYPILYNSFMMPVPKGRTWTLRYYEDAGHNSAFHGRIYIRWTALGQ